MLDIRKLDADSTHAFLNRNQDVPKEVVARATEICADVELHGDIALASWTQQLDGVFLEDPFLADDEWLAGAATCPPDVKAAIDGNLARIRAFHARQEPVADSFDVAPGVTLGRRPVALDTAACYVPGGRASYPSSVMMAVVPAAIARVPNIIVVTPPGQGGAVDPAVLYAAQAAGATRILRAGGAQAIAAVAHGTDMVPRADCIVGPGNAYVTAAKQLLQHKVRIDSPAGPSELLVIADETADARLIALDVMAQAEHDPDAQCIVATTSEAFAGQVNEHLAQLVPKAARADIITASLAHGAILIASRLADAIEFANEYAGEHVEIHTAEPRSVAEQVHNAGSIFIGPHAPVPVGDYGSGTNHVLPTMGYARTHGGLSVSDFVKWVTWQELTPAGLASIAPDIVALARAEGLHAHADAVEGRQ